MTPSILPSEDKKKTKGNRSPALQGEETNRECSRQNREYPYSTFHSNIQHRWRSIYSKRLSPTTPCNQTRLDSARRQQAGPVHEALDRPRSRTDQRKEKE
jgi:hypothetical protein